MQPLLWHSCCLFHLEVYPPTDCGVNITMPVADILRDETDNNYAKAKAAFTSLSKKGAYYEATKTVRVSFPGRRREC